MCISLVAPQHLPQTGIEPHSPALAGGFFITEPSEKLPAVVFTCISLIISGIEHLFMCLFAIYMSSFEKFLFRSSAHLLIGVFGFLILSFLSCLYIWRLIPCQVLHLQVVSLILRVVFPSRLWFPFVQKLVCLFILIALGLHCSAWGFSSYGYVGCSVMSDSL